MDLGKHATIYAGWFVSVFSLARRALLGSFLDPDAAEKTCPRPDPVFVFERTGLFMQVAVTVNV